MPKILGGPNYSFVYRENPNQLLGYLSVYSDIVVNLELCEIKIPKSTPIPAAIEIYEVITGACSGGLSGDTRYEDAGDCWIIHYAPD